MILDDLKVIFFHVGKAGGSTVERVLSSFSIHKDLIHHPSKSPLYGRVYEPKDFELRKKFMMGFLDNKNNTNGVSGTYLQHADIEIFKKIHGDKYDGYDYLKFAFIRNPYDRILSAYYYNAIDKICSFEDFICKGLLREKYQHNIDRNDRFSNNHFAPQHIFTHYNGFKYVDVIGKLENFDNNLRVMLHHLELKYDKDFPKLAKTKKGVIYDNYLDAYTPEMLIIINQIYKLDFELYGYEYKGI